jgi:hypothetical protein
VPAGSARVVVEVTVDGGTTATREVPGPAGTGCSVVAAAVYGPDRVEVPLTPVTDDRCS